MRLLRRLARNLRSPVLALGGGGARGFAHIGVLKALDEAGLEVEAIAGTSMGALIGAMYLGYGSAAAVEERWQEAFERKLIGEVRGLHLTDDAVSDEHPLLQAARRLRDRVVISLAINRETILPGGEFRTALEFLLPDGEIQDLPRPFVAVATDLEHGSEVRLDRGSIRKSVIASSSIPGVLPPVRLDGSLLVDGGTVAEVPVEAARTLGSPVVAVDVSFDVPSEIPGISVLTVMLRTQLITSKLLRERMLTSADEVIRPATGSVTWSDWYQFKPLIDAGQAVTKEWLAGV